VREAARDLGAVVLLKGPTTIVAEPGGAVLLARAGDARLATLGSGDVLAGVIAALCAGGLDPFRAAAAGAFLHGWAAALGWRRGFVASDLLELLPSALDQLVPTRLET
jgi:ADP-dependent NAD(P)H-hydrate dehydratase / NAD(P)H-hydrate epimerase